MRHLLAGAALLAATLAEPVDAQQPVRPACTTGTLQTAAGAICGAMDTTIVAGQQVTVPVYRGIPYAQAPTGAVGLRWKPTQALPAPDTTIRATAFGGICLQTLLADTTRTSPLTVVDTLATGESEDCLYLNVWTPPGATASSKLPVMVFIHGGAFVIGHGSSPMYNGAYLAASDTVILVTLNYRLGALGFLYSGDNGVNGNFGLLDQQMALRWVRRNIGAFGGDTSQVTLFGESAGAMSTGFHLFQMPSSDSLFRAAIMESNPMGVVYRNTSQAQSDGDSYIKKLCSAAGGTLCDLRARTWFASHAQSATALQVLQAQASFDGPRPAIERIVSGGLEQGLPWTPTVDGQLVLGQPMLGYASGMRRKPYVFGFNRDEGVIFAAFGDTIITATEYGLLLDRIFKLDAGKVRNYVAADGDTAYSATSADSVAGMTTAASALANLITDMAFKCANLVAADSGYSANQAAPGAPPVFGYLFQRSPIPFTMYPKDAECSAGTGTVCHANELPYVFNSLAWADTFYVSAGLQAADTSLARQMGSAWTNFAKRPTQSPVSGWTPYTPNGSVYSWSGTSNGPMVADVASTANCSQLWFGLFPLKPGSVTTTAAGPTSTVPPGTLLGRGR